MKITERRLRSIIRNVIREADESDPIYDPIAPGEFSDDMQDHSNVDFDAEEEGIDIISPDDISDLDDQPNRPGMVDFMRQARTAGADRFDDDLDMGRRYRNRGPIDPSQRQMAIDMMFRDGEAFDARDEDGNEYEQ